MTLLVRRTFVALLALVATAILATSATAAPPQNETINLKAAETFVDVFPSCENDDLYELTLDYNLVEHVTVFDDGRVHTTFTQTGTFEAKALEPRGAGRHRQVHGLGRLQPERQDREQHLHVQRHRQLLGRDEDQLPDRRALQREAERRAERLLALPRLTRARNGDAASAASPSDLNADLALKLAREHVHQEPVVPDAVGAE